MIEVSLFGRCMMLLTEVVLTEVLFKIVNDLVNTVN